MYSCKIIKHFVILDTYITHVFCHLTYIMFLITTFEELWVAGTTILDGSHVNIFNSCIMSHHSLDFN